MIIYIRILELLERKTLIETKISHIKMLKMALFDCLLKNVAVLTEDGAFALFFCPHPRGFDSSRVPTLGNLPSKAKKNANAWDQPGEGGGRAGCSWN